MILDRQFAESATTSEILRGLVYDLRSLARLHVCMDGRVSDPETMAVLEAAAAFIDDAYLGALNITINKERMPAWIPTCADRARREYLRALGPIKETPKAAQPEAGAESQGAANEHAA